MYYSETTKGFYDPKINTEIPGDAVEISRQDHEFLLNGQSSGKIITPDENGIPVLEDVVVTIEELATQKLAAIQAEKCRVRDGGMTVGGMLWDTDKGAIDAYVQFMIKVMLNPSATVANWKASQGVWTEMNATVLNGLMAAWETLQTSVFDWQKAREEEVEDALVLEDIEALEAVSTTYTEPS